MVAEQDAAYVVEVVAHGITGGQRVSLTDGGDDLLVFGAVAAVSFGVEAAALESAPYGLAAGADEE